MSVLIDTNVVLDLLLERAPFVDDAESIFLRIEDGELQAYLCAISVTTIDYLVANALGKAVSRIHMKRLLQHFEIAPVNRATLHEAAHSKMKDFEDAVIAASAKTCGVSAIITRNGKDFQGCGLPVYSPGEWLAAH